MEALINLWKGVYQYLSGSHPRLQVKQAVGLTIEDAESVVGKWGRVHNYGRTPSWFLIASARWGWNPVSRYLICDFADGGGWCYGLGTGIVEASNFSDTNPNDRA